MLFIKSFGFFRNRVHQDRAYTNQRCGIDYTQDHIVQEIGAKSLALPSAIDREPSEQHNWNGMGACYVEPLALLHYEAPLLPPNCNSQQHDAR